MVPEIKLVVSEKNKEIERVSIQIDGDFIKAIEKVQDITNNVLTKLIEAQGDNVEEMMDDVASESDEDDLGSTPIKKKK